MERAYELSQHPMLAGSPQRGLALGRRGILCYLDREPDRARQAGEQFLRMAELNPYPQQLELAHLVLGAACFLRGDFVPAHEHLKQALINYDFRIPHPLDLLFGIHVGVINLGWDSFALWQLGYPDQALRRLHRMLAAAEESDHRETLAFARSMGAVVFLLMAGDAAAARDQVEALRSLQLLHEKEPVFGAWVNSLAGWDPSGEAPAATDLERRARRQRPPG